LALGSKLDTSKALSQSQALAFTDLCRPLPPALSEIAAWVLPNLTGMAAKSCHLEVEGLTYVDEGIGTV
jgi:hypothetical protein